ncbi:MAG: hypothetical protein IKV89_06100 [Clostridia bacterium]|nr:hypothetical protein [Clostridia bacterium]
MGLFSSNCGGNNEFPIWWIIIILLLFCGCGGRGECGNSCGNQGCSTCNPCCD